LFGSVLFVQSGGIACVPPFARQSKPGIWTLPAGVPFGIEYAPR